MLSNEPDFLAQPTALEQLCAARGHVCRMLPKMHPELNPIESFWAWCKQWCRGHCDYRIAGLRAAVPSAVAAVPVASTRRYVRRANRFSSLYHAEATGAGPMPFALRGFAMKKYARHRGVPAFALKAIDADLSAKVAKYEEQVGRLGSEASKRRLAKALTLKAAAGKYMAKQREVGAAAERRRKCALEPQWLRMACHTF